MGLAKHNWLTFLSQTGLHGVAYIPLSRSHAEVVIWSLTILTFLCFASYFCTKAFMTLTEDPIRLEIDTLDFPENSIPFPAVTFCPNQILDELNPYAMAIDQVVPLSAFSLES